VLTRIYFNCLKSLNLNDDDYRIISLGEILTIDGTLKELSDMPMGFEAIRKSKEDKWQVVLAN
jgi:hypothetical protein